MEFPKDKNINLKSFSTIQKILLLQQVLKEMTSIKQRFLDNKNKMIQKIDFNCYTYFKNKIYMKKVFDYCISRKPEENKDYQLIEDSKLYLKNIYEPLYDLFFLIRNNNSLMFKIIELLDKLVYEDFSDFFVNYLYENIIKSSFVNDQLILMIYLLLEKLIIKSLPDDINTNLNKDIPITYLKDSFLFYIFKALTRKIDVRNFLCTILNDFLLKLESFTMPLSVEINIVNRYVRMSDRKRFHSFFKNLGSLTEEEIKKNKKIFKSISKNDNHLKVNTTGNMYLKRTKRIVLGSSITKSGVIYNTNKDGNFIGLEEKPSHIHTLIDDKNYNKSKLSQEIDSNDKNLKKFEERITEKLNNEENKDYANFKINMDIKSLSSDYKSSNNNSSLKPNLNVSKNKSDNTNGYEDDIDENGKIKISYFFDETNITIKKIKENLSKYEKNESNSSINLAMKEYLNNIISQFNLTKNNNIIDEEIFSNSIIIDELKKARDIKQPDSFRGLMNKIRFNHRIITRIILDLINKLKENLVSSPYCIKCISKIIDVLLNKKYNILSENKISNYKLFMFEINFLIGSIILPILKNPEFNGIETNNVISEVASNNLLLISKVLEKMIAGNLFNKEKESYMTIFNKFIIEAMPKLFELIENIDKNFELPKKVKNLIINYNKNEDNQRDINYDYFKENPEENINYQSLCFSWKNVYVLLQTIEKYRQILIDDNTNIEQKIILQTFIEQENVYLKYFFQGLKEKKFDFIYLTKYFYNETFNKNINSKIQDNFIYIKPKPNKDLITAFKKCIVEVLNYANKIQIESFYNLTERKDIKTIPKKIKKNANKKEEEKQNETINNNNVNKKVDLLNKLRNSLIKISSGDKDVDADFKNILFPQIRKNINAEINYNLDNEEVQRVIFCTNFIHMYLRDIPIIYIKNNYSLLFDELILETKKNIEYFKTNALFEYYKKLIEAQKVNIMNSSYYSQTQNLEKVKCIEYLYNKLLLPNKFKIEKDSRNIISNIEYENEQNNQTNNNINQRDVDIIEYLSSKSQLIKNMIDSFPDFHEYEDEYDNILDIEEKANVSEALNNYFSCMKNMIKKEKIIQRFNKNELENIIYDLENYILTKMHDKLFPFDSSKKDVLFYNKCKRLGFIKPENITNDKKIINENLWNQAIKYFDNLDDKLTPIDKIKCISRAFEILQNSLKFTSGNDESGVDDIIKPLIYVLIKSQPKNIFSNYQYCELYLNSELSKKQYGVILAQICLVISSIERMKYNDLIGVSEEKFGKDEEINVEE